MPNTPADIRAALRPGLETALGCKVQLRREAAARNYDANPLAVFDVQETGREPGPEGQQFVTYTATVVYRRNAEVRPQDPDRLDSLDGKRRAALAALQVLALSGVPTLRDYNQRQDPPVRWPNGAADGFAVACDYLCLE